MTPLIFRAIRWPACASKVSHAFSPAECVAIVTGLPPGTIAYVWSAIAVTLCVSDEVPALAVTVRLTAPADGVKVAV